MKMTIYFDTRDGAVTLQSRADGDAGEIGDMRSVLPAGSVLTWPKGVSFDDLIAASSGRIEVEGERVRVIPNGNADTVSV